MPNKCTDPTCAALRHDCPNCQRKKNSQEKEGKECEYCHYKCGPEYDLKCCRECRQCYPTPHPESEGVDILKTWPCVMGVVPTNECPHNKNQTIVCSFWLNSPFRDDDSDSEKMYKFIEELLAAQAKQIQLDERERASEMIIKACEKVHLDDELRTYQTLRNYMWSTSQNILGVKSQDIQAQAKILNPKNDGN